MFNEPRKPHALGIFESLEGRSNFSNEEKHSYRRLAQGYEGELLFHQLFLPHNKKHRPLYDLHFKVNSSETQLDVLIVTDFTIYHLEIKNYTGPFTIENNRWCLDNGKHIQNPLLQLQRANELLTILTKNKNINLPIKSYLLFINPKFHLYKASKELPIIYPNKIRSFFDIINYEPACKNSYIHNYFIANHIMHSQYEILPKYDFAHINKGVFCDTCRSKLFRKSKKLFFCTICRKSFKIYDAFEIAYDDFKRLFPNDKITNRKMQAWVDFSIKDSSIRRYLKKHLKVTAKARASFYS